jgi:hypothetical protein
VFVNYLAMFSVGCLSAPTVPVTPQNSALVSKCQTNADIHNATWIAAAGFAATGGGLGTAGALVANGDVSTQRGLQGGAIAAGALGVIAVAVEGLTAANYNGANCGSLVTPIQARQQSSYELAPILPGERTVTTVAVTRASDDRKVEQATAERVQAGLRAADSVVAATVQP